MREERAAVTVYRDPRDDRWRYRTVVQLLGPLPPDHNGKPRHRINKRGGFEVRVSGTPAINTENAAERAEREHIARVEQEATIAKYAPNTLAPPAPTLSQWFRGTATGIEEYNGRYWTEHAKGQNENRSSTLEAKRGIFETWLEPALGAKRLDEIDLGAINALRAELQTKHGRTGLLSAKSRVNVLGVLATALRYAEDAGVIDRAPKMRIKNPPRAEIEVLDFDQLGRIIGAALHEGDPWATAVMLAADCGLRIGEILALEWRDLDLVAGTITVTRQVRKGVVGPPKSGKPRTVPMTPRLAAHLRSVPRIHAGRVVANDASEPMTDTLSKHGIYRVCRIAGLPERAWHVLRHTYATHLALIGVNPLRLQAWLGHSDMGMTLRYCHHAENHAWPIPDEVLTAGADVIDPSKRVIVQLGARLIIAPTTHDVDRRLRRDWRDTRPRHIATRSSRANTVPTAIASSGISPFSLDVSRAWDGGRTRKPFRAGIFKTPASTSCATHARGSLSSSLRARSRA
jgi:integrase